MRCCYLLSHFCAWLLLTSISACGGSGGSAAPVLNLPNVPESPVSQLVFSDDYIGFFIATQPISTDQSLSTSHQFTQQLYQIDNDNNITPVVLLDTLGAELDLVGNLSFTQEDNILPLDVMIMSDEYILLTVFHRNFDLDPDNDYFNLLIELRTGIVVEAPVGLNQQGNSGRSNLTTLGRDYFPPDTRWNDTEDLYVVSVDYEALDMMIAGEVEVDPDHEEPVDHHSGVPCPPALNDTQDDTNTTNETSEDTTATEDATATETTDTVTTDDATTDTAETAETDSSEPVASTCVEPTDNIADTADTTDTTATTDATAEQTTETAPTTPNDEEPPVPTAIYRMSLGETSTYSLEKISATDDRPGLGQFIVSRSGIVIYRNLDGGDNSYRVLLDHCEGITGRLSTVLIAQNTSLILADDEEGNSSIFEVTERGMNQLMFSCNGNVVRRAYSGYSTKITSLHLPFNSPSIASYNYQHPYFITENCQGGQLFPPQITQLFNPMPSIPGLSSQDVRGLRKSQLFNGKLYCIGYDIALNLAVAELNPSDAVPSYAFLSFDFSDWIPNFDTVHMLGNNQVIFTGTTRISPDINTVILDIDGTVTHLDDTLSGLKVAQQIDITPPPPIN